MKPKQTVRLIDVARAANVSRQTAGAILSGDAEKYRFSSVTAERVRRIADDLSYQPNRAARTLKGKGTGVVGILCRVLTERGHMRVVTECIERLGQEGLSGAIAVSNASRESAERAFREFRGLAVEGVITLDHLMREWPESTELLRPFEHVVAYASGYSNWPGNVLLADVSRRRAAQLAVEHLHKRGRRRIGMFLSYLAPSDQSSREAGYIAAHRDLGLEIDPARVYVVSPEVTGGYAVGHPPVSPASVSTPHQSLGHSAQMRPPTMPEIDEIIDCLVVEQKADALVCGKLEPFAPQWNSAVVARLIERGYRVPEDVAVVSVLDDPVYEYSRPPITAVCLRLEDLGRAMAEMLLRSIEAGGGGGVVTPAERSVMVEPELRRRGTT